MNSILLYAPSIASSDQSRGYNDCGLKSNLSLICRSTEKSGYVQLRHGPNLAQKKYERKYQEHMAGYIEMIEFG